MIKNYREILEKKRIDQVDTCAVCGRFLSFGQPQLAHKAEKSKSNIAKYGLEVIDHADNLELVCSLRCNSAVLIGKGRTAKLEEHLKAIRKKIDRDIVMGVRK